MGNNNELSIKCNGYAENCRCQLIKQNHTKGLPAQKKEVTAKKPRFEASLIPITDGHNATRYSDAVYSRERKTLAALGVELTDHDSISASPSSEDTNILCDRALEYLLKQAEDCRAEYALEFEGLVAEKLNSKLMTIKSLLYNELKTSGDA